jgi:hypothetical protein
MGKTNSILHYGYISIDVFFGRMMAMAIQMDGKIVML